MPLYTLTRQLPGSAGEVDIWAPPAVPWTSARATEWCRVEGRHEPPGAVLRVRRDNSVVRIYDVGDDGIVRARWRAPPPGRSGGAVPRALRRTLEVTLPAATRARLEAIAGAERCSLSAAVVRAVEAYRGEPAPQEKE